MQNSKRLRAIILVTAIMIASCSSRQVHIQLSTALIQRAEPNEVKKINVQIGSIADLRKATDSQSPVFTSARESGGFCRNSERHYSADLAAEIRQTIETYLKNRQVYQGSMHSPSYILTGSLRRFYAEQQASQFPLPKDRTPRDRSGYFRNAGYGTYSTPGYIEIEFSDLYLTDVRNGQKYAVSPLTYRNEAHFEIDDDCFFIYSSINQELLMALKLLEKSLNSTIVHAKQ